MRFILYLICYSTLLLGCQSNIDNIQQDNDISNLILNDDVNQGIQSIDGHNLSYSSQSSFKPLTSLSANYDTDDYKTILSLYVKNSSVPITYVINFDNQLWKLDQESNIINRASEIDSRNLSLSEINSILDDLEVIFESTSFTASDQVLYGLSAAISSFSIAKRTKISPANGGCSLHPGFLVGKSYLGCQEDHIVNKLDLSIILDTYESEFGNSQDINSIRNMLLSNSLADVAFKDIYTSINSTFDLSSTNCKSCLSGCGSEHGCCGNYKGCCYYRHILCFIHDKMCINCSPKLFCLPRCKPGELKVIKDPYAEIHNGEYHFPVYNKLIKHYYVSEYEFINENNRSYSTYITFIDNKNVFLKIGGYEIIPDGYYFNDVDNNYYKVYDGNVIEIDTKPLNCPNCFMPNITNPFTL